MLKILSISLGSKERDKVIETNIGGREVRIERRGTNGDKAQARELFTSYDGKVDAFGLGGTDLYIYAGERAYPFRDSFDLIKNVRQTPVLDGSGIKRSLEPLMLRQIIATGKLEVKGKNVLHMCGVDRYAIGEEFVRQGAQVAFGDLIFGLGLNIPIRSLRALRTLAQLCVPFITHLPINWFYPTGDAQNKKVNKYSKYFLKSDIITGDFLYIKKYMPAELPGKIIITNTVTEKDRQMLECAGVTALVTTAPILEGRSFGTNVLEALLVALTGAHGALSSAEYVQAVATYGLVPGITNFKETGRV